MTDYHIDLSSLPPEQRERWRQQFQSLPDGLRETLARRLSKTPPEKLARILRDTQPMIDRMQGRAEGLAAKAANVSATLPHKIHQFGSRGHYNRTVQRGDGQGLHVLQLLLVAVAVALAAGWLAQRLG